MKDMIRTCHPLTPHVGLFRQFGCPVRTKQSYDKACLERDIACFPSMLHNMVTSFKAFRAIKRLWIQAIHRILSKGLFCDYLTYYTMEFLTLKKDYSRVPYLMFNQHYMRYAFLTIRQRFIQISGKLVSLGYSQLVLPNIEDFDYDVLLDICPVKRQHVISGLYHELKRKKVKNKCRIIMSHLKLYKLQCPFEQYELPFDCYTDDIWETYCNNKKVDIYLDKCLKVNGLSATEIVLIYDWIRYMKYPLY